VVSRTKPFFSIVIPTYNRARYLAGSIRLLLRQSFRDFEIIVSDNHSTDKTESIMQGFRDTRIRYFRNSTNIGAVKNQQRAIRYAKGEYLLLLGDDDYLLFDSCLKQLHDLIRRTHVGFIRIRLLEQYKDGMQLVQQLQRATEDFAIAPTDDALKILQFLDETLVSMMTGLVIKNNKWIKLDFLDTLDTPWIPLIYKTIQEYGGYFASHIYSVVRWSVDPGQRGAYEAYMVRNSRIALEPELRFVIQETKFEDKNNVRKFILLRYVGNIPAIKLYTNNINCLRLVRRLLELDHSFVYSLRFWLLFIGSLLIPKQGFILIRTLWHKRADLIKHSVSKSEIFKRHAFLEQTYFAGFS
jgi:glycosyltransferase involved in cell wall biosynthesis